MTRKTPQNSRAGFELRQVSPGELSPDERAAFGVFDMTPAGVVKGNRSDWRPVTEREDAIDFNLSQREREAAAAARAHLEAMRQQQNDRDALAGPPQPFLSLDPRPGSDL